MLWAVAGVANAQTYPTKPIQFIFAFGPGLILDATAKPVADEMSKRLGQPIVFVYKVGANGTIAAKYVASAKPDGYTFFYNTVTTNDPILNANNGVAAATELAPVSQFSAVQYFLMARTGLPVSSFQELLAYSKQNPTALRYGSAAVNIELYTSLLKSRTGLVAEGIPYKSTTDVIASILGGDVQLALNSVQVYLPHINKGVLRPLLVAAASRSPLLPNVPSSAELGIQNFDMAQNHGLWAPLGTPLAIRQRLSAEVARAVKLPEIAGFIRNTLASEPVGSTPEEQLKVHQRDISILNEAIRLTNFKPQ